MNPKQIEELISFGSMLDVQVTPKMIKGQVGVTIMDFEFTEYIGAVLYLQQMQKSWFPDNAYLVA